MLSTILNQGISLVGYTIGLQHFQDKENIKFLMKSVNNLF